MLKKIIIFTFLILTSHSYADYILIPRSLDTLHFIELAFRSGHLTAQFKEDVTKYLREHTTSDDFQKIPQDLLEASLSALSRGDGTEFLFINMGRISLGEFCYLGEPSELVSHIDRGVFSGDSDMLLGPVDLDSVTNVISMNLISITFSGVRRVAFSKCD